MVAGVYVIRCIPTRKIYVGSTVTSFRKRFSQHRSDLRHGRSGSKLQRAWRKYGEESFEFVPIIESAPENARDHEQLMIDALRPELNIERSAHKATKTRSRSHEQRQRTSERTCAAWARGDFANRERPDRNFYEVRGELLSAKQICLKYNLEKPTLQQRIRTGLRGEDLVKRPHADVRRFEVRGEFLTTAQIAQRYRLQRDTVLYRIRSGVVGDALAKPSRQGGSDEVKRSTHRT